MVSAMLAGACVHEDRRVYVTPSEREVSAPVVEGSLPQYVVADPARAKGAIALALGSGQRGIVVDRRRVVVGRGEPRVATDATTEPITGAAKIPERFGGGFLFWTAHTLYRSDAFEGRLAPVARVPEIIESVSFGPRTALVRTRNGERWGLSLPSGERAPILPLSVVDVQALDDGRALGFSDQGAVFTSVDGGASWVDATVQVRSDPLKVVVAGGDLWLIDQSGAYRLERDGHLSWFDKPPAEPDAELRPKDPRWRGADAPLRAVLDGGAAIDDRTAIVIDSGDVFRVDLHTGEIVSVVVGRLPPDAACHAVPVAGDVLFACSSRASGTSFVASHTLSSEPPLIEQAFPGGGGFFTSDDGGLVFSGPCNGVAAQPAASPVACVRMPSGRWEERDLSGLTLDGGVTDFNVARWVPRGDGRVVAILVEPTAGIYDPEAQTFQPIPDEARDAVGNSGLVAPVHTRIGKIRYRKGAATGFVDGSWSFAGGALRGWQRHGEAVEISEDGRLTRSPYTLEMVFSGPMGLGRSKDGRLYQSIDHGASWVEVAPPPAGIEAVELVGCSSAGCDLGAFYRVGWAARPPRVESPKTQAPTAPEVRRVRGLELSCRPQGGVVSNAVPRTANTPDDLGLGAARIAVADESSDYGYVRFPVPRTIVNPIRDVATGDETASPSLRALFYGFGTTRDGDVLTVTGPNKNAMALRRGFAYAPAFDPTGRVVRTSIAMSDVVAAGRRVGMTTDEVLSEDLTESGNVIPVTSLDPRDPSDVVIHNPDHGLLALVRGQRVRVAIRAAQNISGANATVVSGVLLPGDEAAFLEVDSSGASHVFKLGASGITDLFDFGTAASDTFYPANPDALAVGPKGELAILRTPSGSEPASALDPAFLVVPATPPTALAPWSALELADSPACKADRDGYRATLQLAGPWIRVTTPELRVEDAPMIARVRWSATRLCLEGFELRLPSAFLRPPGAASPGSEPVLFATWLVARGSTFARVGTVEGIEWRQPLECSVATRGP